MKDIVTKVVVIGLLGAVGIGIITHAQGFKTAFGAGADFFLNEMSLLEGQKATR